MALVPSEVSEGDGIYLLGRMASFVCSNVGKEFLVLEDVLRTVGKMFVAHIKDFEIVLSHRFLEFERYILRYAFG